MSNFDVHSNNCWHYVLKEYKSFWGVDCPVQQLSENPSNIMHVHRGAIRLVNYFGLCSKNSAKDGSIVLIGQLNIVHHFGFIKSGVVRSFTDQGLVVLDGDQIKKMGVRLKYLNITGG